MRIGIIGYKGFVGSAFYEHFCTDKNAQVIGIGKEEYAKNVGSHFDLIVNANGNSSKVLAQRDPKKDLQMNVNSTLASIFDFPTEKYVYISSGEVYNDKENEGENSEEAEIVPQKLSNYGLSKYMGEMIVKKYAKNWLIVRLGGMVGKNMKKGPVFDILNLHKLFISSKSKLQFLNTQEVASITKKLIEKQKWKETYNILGDGDIELEKIAEIAGTKIISEGNEKAISNITIDKIKKEIGVSTTKETIEKFCAQKI